MKKKKKRFQAPFQSIFLQKLIILSPISNTRLGYGYIYHLGNGASFGPYLYDDNDNELPPGYYNIQPDGDAVLAVAPYQVQ